MIDFFATVAQPVIVRIKGTTESDEEFLAKYKNVVKCLKKGKSLRDTAKLCDVSLGTVQKVKKVQVIFDLAQLQK